MRLKILSAIITVACLAVSQAHADLIVNGSFEDPMNDPSAPGHYTTYFAPSTAITGWTVGAGSVDIVDALAAGEENSWDAQDGIQSLDLNGTGTGPGSISQSFATIFGELYELAFFYANNPKGGASMNVLIDGGIFASLSHSNSATNSMNWTPFSQSFAGTGNPMTLTFESTTPGNVGIALDNVDVSLQASQQAAVTPEPTSLALLGIGAAGLAVGAIRRRRIIHSSR